MNVKKLKALKTYLVDMNYASAEELEETTVENTFNECYNTFEIISREYKVLTDAEADEEAKESILNDLWAFNADFILEHTEFYETSTPRENEDFIKALTMLQSSICESANVIVKSLIIDIDEFVDDAINVDGRGHFISYYDGKEHEQDDFYIYRTN